MNPYENTDINNWEKVTQKLIKSYPIPMNSISESVYESWDKILSTKIGGELEFGKDYKPSPQMLGNFLHTMVPILLEKKHPGIFRIGVGNLEKDVIYKADDQFSFEIKTSSSKTIYANRSYAQPRTPGSKNKDGYYLAINFESYKLTNNPKIKNIKFGWINHSDWKPQDSATGQQASLMPSVWDKKFIQIT